MVVFFESSGGFGEVEAAAFRLFGGGVVDLLDVALAEDDVYCFGEVVDDEGAGVLQSGAGVITAFYQDTVETEFFGGFGIVFGVPYHDAFAGGAVLIKILFACGYLAVGFGAGQGYDVGEVDVDFVGAETVEKHLLFAGAQYILLDGVKEELLQNLFGVGAESDGLKDVVLEKLDRQVLVAVLSEVEAEFFVVFADGEAEVIGIELTIGHEHTALTQRCAYRVVCRLHIVQKGAVPVPNHVLVIHLAYTFFQGLTGMAMCAPSYRATFSSIISAASLAEDAE